MMVKGRARKFGDNIDTDTITPGSLLHLSPEELAGKITIGVLVDRDLPIYTQEYRRIREAAKAALK